jgi:hypothetical protein
MDRVQQQLNGGALEQISNQLGLDPAATQRAVTVALPVVLAGMARQASNPTAAAAIDQEAGNFAVPADMTRFAGIPSGLGGGILSTILGGNQQPVHDGVSQASGLDAQKAARLVAMLAPFVLSALANRRRDPTQVADSLQRAQQSAQAEAQRQSPHLGGILGSIMNQVMSPDHRS